MGQPRNRRFRQNVRMCDNDIFFVPNITFQVMHTLLDFHPYAVLLRYIFTDRFLNRHFATSLAMATPWTRLSRIRDGTCYPPPLRPMS